VPVLRYCVGIRTSTDGSTAGSTSVTCNVLTICPSCVRVPKCLSVAGWLSTARSRTTSSVYPKLVRCWFADSFRAGSTLPPSRMNCGNVFAGNRRLLQLFVGKVSPSKIGSPRSVLDFEVIPRGQKCLFYSFWFSESPRMRRDKMMRASQAGELFQWCHWHYPRLAATFASRYHLGPNRQWRDNKV